MGVTMWSISTPMAKERSAHQHVVILGGTVFGVHDICHFIDSVFIVYSKTLK